MFFQQFIVHEFKKLVTIVTVFSLNFYILLHNNLNVTNQVKEKKTHVRTPKPPFMDFSPLKSSTVRVLSLSAAVAAFGIYTPIFFMVRHYISYLMLLYMQLRYNNFALTCPMAHETDQLKLGSLDIIKLVT